MTTKKMETAFLSFWVPKCSSFVRNFIISFFDEEEERKTKVSTRERMRVLRL